jgi:hypothetical protein
MDVGCCFFMFIELTPTAPHHKQIHVVIDKIDGLIRLSDDYCPKDTCVMAGENFFSVKETPEQIADAIALYRAGNYNYAILKCESA